MEVAFTGRQMDATEDLRQFTLDHLHKLERLLHGRSQLHVVLTAERQRRLAEITLTLKTQTLVGINESHDAHTSIKGAIDKLERQVVRWRKKRLTKTHRSKPTIAVVKNVLSAAKGRSKGDGNLLPERRPLEFLTVTEAVDSLGSAKDGILVFRNFQTARVNIIYRRPDNKIGLIEPVS